MRGMVNRPSSQLYVIVFTFMNSQIFIIFWGIYSEKNLQKKMKRNKRENSYLCTVPLIDLKSFFV